MTKRPAETEAQKTEGIAQESDLKVLTKSKTVILTEEDSENRKEVILYPFRWKHFHETIKIVNRYWGCYEKVAQEYNQLILDIDVETQNDEDDTRKQILVKNLNKQFNEIGKTIKNILQSDEQELHNDIQKIIKFCLKDRELDFDDLNFGEVTCLLTAAIEVNMDFFEENLNKLELFKEQNKKLPTKTKDGELKSAA